MLILNMCPRIKVLRKVLSPPIIKGFMPYGPETGKQKQDLVNLLYEEYEALRLNDYDLLNHHQASAMMGVSRPTFTRIYASALQKIAKAFVECLAIEIEGGNVEFGKQWFKCNKCFKLIEGIENHIKCKGCDSYGNKELVNLNIIK